MSSHSQHLLRGTRTVCAVHTTCSTRPQISIAFFGPAGARSPDDFEFLHWNSSAIIELPSPSPSPHHHHRSFSLPILAQAYHYAHLTNLNTLQTRRHQHNYRPSPLATLRRFCHSHTLARTLESAPSQFLLYYPLANAIRNEEAVACVGPPSRRYSWIQQAYRHATACCYTAVRCAPGHYVLYSMSLHRKQTASDHMVIPAQ